MTMIRQRPTRSVRRRRADDARRRRRDVLALGARELAREEEEEEDDASTDYFRETVNLARRRAVAARARASNDDDEEEEGTFRLVMLRHAASSWAETEVKDADRPLTEAGRASASATARNVAGRGWMPDLTLCSNSRRSRETVEVMRATDEGFGRAERTSYLGSLYHFASLDGQLRHHLNECVLERTTTRDEDAGAGGESVGGERV